MSVVGFWRFNKERYKLSGSRCPDCGALTISPRIVCPICTWDTQDRAEASRSLSSHQLKAGIAPPQAIPPIAVSIIIPAHNAQDTIVQTLSSSIHQALDAAYEIIVVDSSTDETPKLVREKFPMVRLLHSETHLHSGAARNFGIQKARGKLIAFTDANCILPPDWLQRLVDMHARHPDCAAIGGPIVNGNPEHTLSWVGYLAEFNTHLPVGISPHAVDHISTGNIAYKRRTFERHGGFPGNEMVEHVALLFNRMLHSKGEKLLFDPRIIVALSPPTSLREFLVHQRTIGRGTVQAMRRLADITGAEFARHRLLTFLSTPAIATIKLLRNGARFMNWSAGLVLRHPLLLPLFCLGLVAWGIGFAGEALIGEEYEGVWPGNRSLSWA